MKKYKVVFAENGLRELEEKVSKLLNEGWKLSGGIAFNKGFPYQAMGIISEEKKRNSNEEKIKTVTKKLSANEAMKKIDDLI